MLQVYNVDPSGISLFGLEIENTIARTPVHAADTGNVLPAHPNGRNSNDVASFLIAEFTVQSGTTTLHVSAGPFAATQSASVVHETV
jgi:hypothetical protein